MNHDSRGRLSGEDGVDSSNNVLTSYVSSIGYNEAGQVTGLSLGNGVNETYGYSADRLQLTSQTATVGTTPLINVKYIYQTAAGDSGVGTTANNSGQLMMISGTIGPQSRTQRFKYDDLGRLVSALGKGRWEQSYSYDRWGNRTSVHNTMTGQDIQNVTLQHQQGAPAGVPSNQIATVNGVTYSYDPSGNLTSDVTHNYQYDAESRLVTVDVNTAIYTYDSSNRRVKKTAGGLTTHYVWEGSQVIAEYNSVTSTLISEYVFAGSRMVAREQSGGLMYFLQDRLSTRLITDSSGNWVGREDHLPFGEDAGTSVGPESEKHRFTTYERDSESGTDYAINRQYSNSTGRFNRPDPSDRSYDGSNPQTLNRYTYVSNDPVNFADPLGLLTVCFWSIQQISVPESPLHPRGTADVLVFEGCFDFPDVGIGGERGGGGGGQTQKPQPPQQPKKKCKQDPHGGDIPEIKDYLERAGLMGLIDANSIQPSKEGITFAFNNRAAAIGLLSTSPNFRGPNIWPLNSQHTGQVGGGAQDYRSYTVGSEALGPKSLQVEVGRAGTVPNQPTAARGYADIDCSNPAQDLWSAIKHVFAH